jgi:hypothetical protein
MTPKVDTIAILVFLFAAVTAMQHFGVEPNQALLGAILLALQLPQQQPPRGA